MPNYDYACMSCKATRSFIVAFENREKSRMCPICGERMSYQFPVQAARGIRTFKPFYCEALDCDVSTKREWNAILKDKGVEEAGDRVHGGRNFDPKANNILPQDPQGVNYVWESEKRLAREAEGRNVLLVEGKDGYEIAQDRGVSGWFDPGGERPDGSGAANAGTWTL